MQLISLWLLDVNIYVFQKYLNRKIEVGPDVYVPMSTCLVLETLNKNYVEEEQERRKKLLQQRL